MFKKFYQKAVLACGALMSPAIALAAEGDVNNAYVGTTLDGWITTAKTEMGGWGEKLAPIFAVGIGLVLLAIAYRLFKRVTKAAS